MGFTSGHLEFEIWDSGLGLGFGHGGNSSSGLRCILLITLAFEPIESPLRWLEGARQCMMP